MSLSFEEWMAELRSIERSAFHLERQRYYAIDLDVYDRWRAGDHHPPVDEPAFRDWYDLVAGHVDQGRTVARVRVLEEPPTEYQDFELWCGQWNTAHGEELRSIPRSTAEQLGLVAPDGQEDDWWLLDGERLLVMPFDVDGNLTGPYLVTDPEAVEAAVAEWALALANSTVDVYPGAGTDPVAGEVQAGEVAGSTGPSSGAR